jgi:signal-transduction protein with cAMP-binding, CBS, and nucleotidyltransferase domain
MVDRHIHRVFVVEDDQLIGVLSVHDVMQVVANLRVPVPLDALMTKNVITVQVHDGIGMAAERLRDSKKHALVVFDEEWPVGTISQDELLLARDWPDDTPVESWMNLRMLCLPVRMPAFRAAAHALALNARHVLAMSDVRLEGIVTSIDFARALAQ